MPILQSSAVAWIIDKVPDVTAFLLTVLVFGLFMFIGTKILRLGSKRTEFAPEKQHFLRKSIFATLLIGIVVVILGFIFLVLFAAFLFSSGGASDPFGAILGGTLGGAAQALFASELNLIIFFLVCALIILLAIGATTKSVYQVSFLWGLLTFIVAALFYFGVDYLIDQFIYSGGFGGLFDWVGNELYILFWGWAFPPTT